MPITVKVKVLREMRGDKDYQRGDFRELAVADAERLAATGAVEILGKPKMDSGVRNKRAPAVKNKAAKPSRAARRRAATEPAASAS